MSVFTAIDKNEVILVKGEVHFGEKVLKNRVEGLRFLRNRSRSVIFETHFDSLRKPT